MIRTAFLEGLRRKQQREQQYFERQTTLGKLWATDLGSCPRKVMLRVLGQATPLPDVATLDRWENGNALERSTLYLLTDVYEERLVRGFRMTDERWIAKCDAVLDHPREGHEVRPESFPIILEHKGSSDRWWDYDGKLPDRHHVLQLAFYGDRYHRHFGVWPMLILYYRAWGHFAEFTITRDDPILKATGMVDDQPRVVEFPLDLPAQIAELERWYDVLCSTGSLVAGALLPPRLDNPAQGCTFRGAPSCPFFQLCWGGPAGSDDVVTQFFEVRDEPVERPAYTVG